MKERYYLFGLANSGATIEGDYCSLENLNIRLSSTNWDSVRVIKGTEITIKKTFEAVEEENII
jgi:hypothetical protein